jgi:cytidylate kinase
MIITIDGPVATGKSTIAKRLAKILGFIHFDTGAMYRAITYGILKEKIDCENEKKIEEFLQRFELSIKLIDGEKHYYLGTEDITNAIRSLEVTALVSKVAAFPSVRKKLVSLQRSLSAGADAVFEGRDLGSVVFPNAEVKIFLTASSEVRALRRYEELLKKFPDEAKKTNLTQMTADINDRDRLDSTRAHSPLVRALDAHLIDTSDLTIDQVVEKILTLVSYYRGGCKTSSLKKQGV